LSNDADKIPKNKKANSNTGAEHALMHVALSGERGINGATAFWTGMSLKDIHAFKENFSKTVFKCPRTEVEVSWNLGDGGNRVSHFNSIS
jgi:hypothetical protein